MSWMLPVAAALPLSAQPGSTPPQRNLRCGMAKAALRSSESEIRARQQFPGFRFGKRLERSPLAMPFAVLTPAAGAQASPRVPMRAAYEPAAYAFGLSGQYSGLLSYNISAPINFTPYAQVDNVLFNGGSTVRDGKLCGVYYNDAYASIGVMFAYYAELDLATGELIGTPSRIEGNSLIALATATDPKTGEVFGEFYTANLKGREFGVADYDAKTRTTVSTASHDYVVMGIGMDGMAYGIDQQGDLYIISRTDGQETLIGSTGLEVTGSAGDFYMQGGAIDPQTGVFYWAYTSPEGRSAVYSVSLTDAKATKIADSGYQQMAFNIPAVTTSALAPSMVDDMAIGFSGGSTTGTVAFTLPTVAFDGATTLRGSLAWQLSVNGTELSAGEGVPGQRVTVPASQLSEGMTRFEVVASNGEGAGPVRRKSAYVGFDTPLPPTGVVFSVDDSRKATVSWEAPAGGTHGGYLGELTYVVYQMGGMYPVAVVRDVKGTTATFDIPDGAMRKYVYGVAAVNNGHTSSIAQSNGLIVGNPKEVPFFDDFNEGIDLYTVIDANNDGSTWDWDNERKAASYFYSRVNAADDWLISPPIALQAGKNYIVSFRASASNPYIPERIEAKWGNAPEVEAMTQELLPATDLRSRGYVAFEQRIRPEESGAYYMGFHAISDADEFRLFLDSLSVEEGPADKAPAAVTALSGTPAANGDLSCTLSFNLPTLAYDGSALQSVTSVKVMRGNSTVYTSGSESLSPGQRMTVTDNKASQGVNKYEVYVYNGAGQGDRATLSVSVGVDTPTTPFVEAEDRQTSVRLVWDDLEGSHGGPVKLDEISYEIYDVTAAGALGEMVATELGGNESIVDGLNNDEGEQSYRQWAVRAVNAAGASDYGTAHIIVGKPYVLPYRQSFAGGGLGGYFIGVERSSDAFRFAFDTADASDADGGSLSLSASDASLGMVSLGKMSFQGVSKPSIRFSYKAEAHSPLTLAVQAQLPDGSMTRPFSTISFAENTETGWQTVTIDLPSQLSTQRYAILCIAAQATGVISADHPVRIDDIRVMNKVENDAAVAIAAPAKVTKGQSVSLRVRVTNEGISPLTSARVVVTAGDKTIDERTTTRTLASLESEEYTVSCLTSSLDDGNALLVAAKVTHEGDENAANDMATASVELVSADVASPSNLNAEGDSPVELTWDAPANTIRQVTDGFEDYAPWAIDDFGMWTTVKRDAGIAGSIAEKITLPGENTSYAFINWQPSDYFGTGTDADPHGGKRCLAAFYQINKAQSDFVDVDAWLISPQLSGRAQTIGFWVANVEGDETYGMESYELYYSATGKQPEDFNIIGGTREQNSNRWEQVTFDVPEGAKYFAVRHCTPGEKALCFMLDDFTYEAGMTPAAYRVYRDGELLASVGQLSYTDSNPLRGTHTYQVTAVYDDGVESAPISVTTVTSIASLEASGVARFNVFTPDGKQVLRDAATLRGLQPGAYIINGQKIIIR